MSDEELFNFLNGAWTATRSSHIVEARYDEEKGWLEVRFKGGASGAYTGVSFDEAEAFGRSPSKGGYKWDELIPAKIWIYT